MMTGLSIFENPGIVLKHTWKVEVCKDDIGQEPMHVKMDPAILHTVRDDGLHWAKGKHTCLVYLPPEKAIPQSGKTNYTAKMINTWGKEKPERAFQHNLTQKAHFLSFLPKSRAENSDI